MLAEDTRQSLAIEGHFATEEELEAVLGGRKLYSHAPGPAGAETRAASGKRLR